MKEFIVNDYITLKLEDGNTNIYVNNDLFRQCKFLLLSIPISQVEDFAGISSIDEAEEQLDRSMEDSEGEVIPPETEFWAHCSNMQVWYENEYDSRLLHRNLAFPLLKRLTDVGDPQAKMVFKEEIMKRLSSNHPTVIKYLFKERFIEYLDREDLITSLINPKEAEIIIELEHLLDSKFIISESTDRVEEEKTAVGIKERKVLSLQCFLQKNDDFLTEIPDRIKRLKHLKHLYMSGNDFINLPEWICDLKSLEVLDISSCELELLPECIGNLKTLKILNIFNNYLTELPSSIGKLTNLVELRLDYNWLNKIPDSLGYINKLKYLDLCHNSLSKIPSEIGKLSNLKELTLDLNHLQKIPDSFQNLHKLENVDISGNYFEIFPDFLIDLPVIRKIKVDKRLLKKIERKRLDEIKLKKIDLGV